VEENDEGVFDPVKKFDDIVISSFPKTDNYDKDGNRSPMYMLYTIYTDSLGQQSMRQFRI
jgi:hypothetical protein